jgi:cytoplasmic iron level regulating protein YaaA (DUF328/UPF0246 family)
MRKVALIACTKEKESNSCAAISMYQGEFKNWLKHAQQLNLDQIYILSGKFGLLLPDELIEPYDFNLNLSDREYYLNWNERVIKKLKELENLEETLFYMFTNHHYASEMIKEMSHYEFPVHID